MIERVVQDCGERDSGKRRLAIRFEEDREAETRDDDADVLDRRIREQTFHVGLRGGENHAEERRGESQHEPDDAPPPQLHVQQIEAHPQQAVDRSLEHDAAHERRHRRRCGGMRFR